MINIKKIAAVCALTFSTLTWADSAEDIDQLWDKYAVNEVVNDEEALHVLEQIIQKEPDNIRALKSAVYLKLRQSKPLEAESFIGKVLAITPNDEALKLQKAYLLNQRGANAEALIIFDSLKNSHDKRIADAACQASFNLTPSSNFPKIKKPYFSDLYASPSYESRNAVAIIPMKLRAGRYYNSEKGQLYGFTTFNRDTKSAGGVRPEIIDENSLILGLGINHSFGSSLPITAYTEIGGSYDLIDRGRKKLQEYAVVGAATYKEWGDTRPACRLGCSFPMTFHADFYGNVAAYSRNDYNVIADLRYRPGINIMKDDLGVTKLYFKLKSVHDTEREFFNNVLDLGLGVSYKLTKSVPLSVRFELMKAYYLGEDAPNGDSGFSNNRVEITYYKGF